MLIALGVVVLIWAAAVVALVTLGRGTHARELALLLPNLLRLVTGLLRDDRVPRSSKLLLGFAAIWVASPIDLIPEFLPVLGPLDDVVVVALVLRHVLRRAGEPVLRDHWHGEEVTLGRLLRLLGRPAPEG